MEKLDLDSLKLDQLKAIAKANNIEVGGTAKQPFLDAIAEYAQENELIVPEEVLTPAPEGNPKKDPTLPQGSYRYRKMRKVEDEWKEDKMVILTEEQATTLNLQTDNSNHKYVLITK